MEEKTDFVVFDVKTGRFFFLKAGLLYPEN